MEGERTTQVSSYIFYTANPSCPVTGHSHSVESVAWNNDDTKFTTGSRDGTVKVWSVGSAGTFKCQSTLSGHSESVNTVSWNPDGTMLASGSDDKTVRIWGTSLDK
jgi:WD40 repeat protein